MKYKKIILVCSGIIGSLLFVLGTFYFLGKPNFDKVYAGNRFYVVDLFTENIYVYISPSIKIMASKSNSIFDERISEASQMAKNKEVYREKEFGIFESTVDKNIKRSNYLCSKIKNSSTKDDCYAQLFGKILNLSEILYGEAGNTDLAKELVEKATESLEQVSSAEKKKDAVMSNSARINTLSVISEELKNKAEEVGVEGDEQFPDDNDKDNDSEPLPQESEYLPIDQVDKSVLNQAIVNGYNRPYLASKIICNKKKGFISVAIADREEIESGIGSDNVGVLIFVNTKDGLKLIDFDIAENDFEDNFNNTPELNRNLTLDEFKNLCPEPNGDFVPIESAEIEYY